jgi:hypothetical protein
MILEEGHLDRQEKHQDRGEKEERCGHEDGHGSVQIAISCDYEQD